MRRLVILCTLILTFSCSTEKPPPSQAEIVKANIEEYVLSSMNDPQSYEFVNLELIDSALYSDNIQFRREYFIESMQYDIDRLQRLEEYKAEFPSLYDEEEFSELIEKITINEKILAAIDSVESGLGSRNNEVASYTYVYSFRANNAMGAKMLSEYILQTGPAPDFTAINFTDDQDQVDLSPNEFPGYQEIIAKF